MKQSDIGIGNEYATEHAGKLVTVTVVSSNTMPGSNLLYYTCMIPGEVLEIVRVARHLQPVAAAGIVEAIA